MASGAEGLDSKLLGVSLEGAASSSSRPSASTDASEDPSARTFELELVARSAPGRGAVATCAAAAGGLVVVGTSSGTCTVHDFADGTSRDVDCASLVHSGRGASSPSVAGIGSDALGRLTSAFGASVSTSSSAAQNPPRAVAVSAVWLDPTGAHCVVTLVDAGDGAGAGCEEGAGCKDKEGAGWGYFHARSWRRPKRLAAPSNATGSTPRSADTPATGHVRVTALGWRPDACDDRVARDVLVGTSDGRVHEVSLDAGCGEDGPRRPDKGCRLLIDLSTVDDTPRVNEPKSRAVRGIRTCVVDSDVPSGAKLYTVLVATAERLRCFTGGDTLARTFQGPGGRGPRGGGIDPIVSMPTGMGGRDRSELHAWSHDRGGAGVSPDRVAWLVPHYGVYYGHLDVTGCDPSAADTVLQNHSLVPFPPDLRVEVGTGSEFSSPRSMAPTRHHVLAAFKKRLVAVNAVTGNLAAELNPHDVVTTFARSERKKETGGPDGLPNEREAEDCGDNACLATDDVVGVSFLITTRGHVVKISAKDEDKDAWRGYLARHDFTRALSHCRTDAQREEVHCAQAERAMAANDAGKAARCYAKAGDFVDADVVVKMFRDRNEVDALETYLRRRLDLREAEGAPDGDPAARQLAAWLLDLNVSRAEAAAGTSVREDEFIAAGSLQHFIHEHGARLDFAHARKTLVQRGRMDDAAHLCEAFGDWDGAVTHWLAVRQDPAEAARVIGNPRIPPDTRLRHAPALFTLDPKTAVDAFIADDGLDVTAIASRVIDLLVVAVDPGDVAMEEGARYLTHVVTRRRVTDRGVHDLTLRLLVRRHDKDPHALVRYLDGAGWDEQTGVSRYDPLLAADLCERAGAVKAAIRVHCDRGDHDRAIALAMRSDDLALAKSVLDAVDGARGARFGVTRRDIWRKIAVGVVVRGFGASVSEADVAEGAELRKRYEDTFGDGGEEMGLNPNPKPQDEPADPKLAPTSSARIAAEAYAVSRACGASSSSRDPTVRKRVVDKIAALVKESNGTLGVDDVLPYFPAAVVSVDEWRVAVLADLSARDARVDAHNSATAEANAKIEDARRTLSTLETRDAVIGWDEPCARCGGAVSQTPFSYNAFASQGAFLFILFSTDGQFG